MNNNKIASPAQKQVSPSTEKFQNGLAQVEGIITSPPSNSKNLVRTNPIIGLFFN